MIINTDAPIRQVRRHDKTSGETALYAVEFDSFSYVRDSLQYTVADVALLVSNLSIRDRATLETLVSELDRPTS